MARFGDARGRHPHTGPFMLLAGHAHSTIGHRLARELGDVEARFGAALLSDVACVNSLVTHIERYRGKMLRPSLVLASGMATAPVGADLQEAHRAVGVVVEMIHMATLIHDDILDDADMRRGGVTVNRLRGDEAAVMLGDYLLSHAFRLCAHLPDARASQVLSLATNCVCEGELLQLSNRNNWSLDERTYFDIINRKTASLCGVCCRLGALLHDVPDAVTDGFCDFGEKVGMAFQIVDDLLDLTGDEETVGKTLGRDLQKGKPTLALIHFLRTADNKDRQWLLSQLQPGGGADTGRGGGNGTSGGAHKADANPLTPAQLAQIASAMERQGSLAYARDCARRLIEVGKASLRDAAGGPAVALMLDIADTVVVRKF
jgi:octaprenyl-diphosphate synthase